MKKIVEDVSNEGLESLLGETVTLFCVNYFYTGKLTRVNDTCVLLKDPKIIYETGPFSNAEWEDAQSLPNDLYVQIAAIESFGIVK